MSKVQTPPEKKRLAYARDHYAKGKVDKARKTWRTKKSKAIRSYRHAADSLTKAAVLDQESETKIGDIKQRSHQKWPVPSLRERVEGKLDRRVRSVGAKKERQ